MKISLFKQVGLRANVVKMFAMVCQPGIPHLTMGGRFLERVTHID